MLFSFYELDKDSEWFFLYKKYRIRQTRHIYETEHEFGNMANVIMLTSLLHQRNI